MPTSFVRCLPTGAFALAVACGEDPVAADDDSSSTDPMADSDSGSSGVEPSPSTSNASVDDTTTDEPTTTGTSLDSTDSGTGTESGGAAPIANDDVFKTPTDELLVVEAISGLLANDDDPAGGALVIFDADAQTERGGTVDVDPFGAFTYTPPAGDWGPDSFGYTVADAQGGMASAVATINITPIAIPLDEIAVGHGGFVIDGNYGDQSGYTVAGAGDVNGDGLEDVLVGSPYEDSTLGRVDVVFGKTDLDNVVLSDIADGTGGFRIRGGLIGWSAGYSVAGAGDVNGDGLADILVGTEHGAFGGMFTLTAYVVFGKDGDTELVDLVGLADDDAGFVLEATAQMPGNETGTGIAVAAAGDVNGDGLGDILVGIESAPDTGFARAWVVFGKDETDVVDLEVLGASGDGFVLEGEVDVLSQGNWLGGGGDVDGDGLDDVLVGISRTAVGGANYAGRCYVVRGKADADPVVLADLATGTGGFVIQGSTQSELACTSVTGAGDVNGDGLADILLSTLGYDAPSYVVHGKADTEPVLLSAVEGGDGGFVITGGESFFLASLAGGGDIDGDGLDDVVIGVPYAESPIDGYGHTFVVYGKADTEAVDPNQVTGDGGFAFVVETNTDGVDAVGLVDMNGDLLADVLIGNSNPLSGAPYAGRTYVVAGTSTAPYP